MNKLFSIFLLVAFVSFGLNAQDAAKKSCAKTCAKSKKACAKLESTASVQIQTAEMKTVGYGTSDMESEGFEVNTCATSGKMTGTKVCSTSGKITTKVVNPTDGSVTVTKTDGESGEVLSTETMQMENVVRSAGVSDTNTSSKKACCAKGSEKACCSKKDKKACAKSKKANAAEKK